MCIYRIDIKNNKNKNIIIINQINYLFIRQYRKIRKKLAELLIFSINIHRILIK